MELNRFFSLVFVFGLCFGVRTVHGLQDVSGETSDVGGAEASDEAVAQASDEAEANDETPVENDPEASSEADAPGSAEEPVTKADDDDDLVAAESSNVDVTAEDGDEADITFPEDDCKCEDKWDPLCSNQEGTYENQCHLDCAIKHDSTIALAHKGVCQGFKEPFLDEVEK